MKKQEIINFWEKLWISQNNILRILEKITGLDKNQLFLNDKIDDKFIYKIEKYFIRLVSWEPIEYILQKAEFYWFDFFVDSRVLVPRNDTEIMVEQVLENILKNTILIDVWTGSSCISISILKNANNIEKCYVIDISKKALEVSKINIKKYNLGDKVEQIQGDLLNNFLEDTSIFNKNQDINLENIIITANLPYIKNRDFKNMDEQTINFEPDLALFWWDKTGFELYEKLIFQIFELQSISNIQNIILFIEIWFDQKQIVIDFLEKNNLQFEIFKDNWGIDRCIKIYF